MVLWIQGKNIGIFPLFQKGIHIPFTEMIDTVNNARDKQPGKNSKKPAYKKVLKGSKMREL